MGKLKKRFKKFSTKLFNFWSFEVTVHPLKIIKHQELTGLDRIWGLLRWRRMVDISPNNVSSLIHSFSLSCDWKRLHLIRWKSWEGSWDGTTTWNLFNLWETFYLWNIIKPPRLVLKLSCDSVEQRTWFLFVLPQQLRSIRATARETQRAIRNVVCPILHLVFLCNMMTFTQINLREQTQTRHSCSAPMREEKGGKLNTSVCVPLHLNSCFILPPQCLLLISLPWLYWGMEIWSS